MKLLAALKLLAPRVAVPVTLSILCLILQPHVRAQEAQRVYVERKTTHVQLISHGITGDRYMLVPRQGAYPINENWMAGSVIEETGRGAAFYEVFSSAPCENGDIAFLQFAPSGGRIFGIDGARRIRPIPTLPTFDPTFKDITPRKDFVSTDGTFDIRENVSGTAWISVNCGANWYSVTGGSQYEGDRVKLHDTQPLQFALLGTKQGSTFWYVARGYVDTTGFVVTPIPLNHILEAVPSHLAFAGDSLVVWIRDSSRAGEVDSICYGTMGDSAYARCTAGMAIAGSDTIASLRTMQIFGNKGGTLVALAADGKQYQYSKGIWKYSRTLPRPNNRSVTDVIPAIRAGGVVSYLAKSSGQDSIVIVTLDLADTVTSRVYRLQVSRHPFLPELMTTFNASFGVISYTIYRSSFVVDTNRYVIPVNSMVPEVEALMVLPILCGFAQDTGGVLVVSWDDYLVEPQPTSVGHVKSLFSRGEQGAFTDPSSYQNSTTGLRTPFVGSDEVIFPGTQTTRFDRSGHLLGVLDKKPSTAIMRLQDGRLAIASGTTLRYWRDGSVRDSTELRGLLCDSDTLRSGYISSLRTIGDSGVVALVNGLRMEDAQSLEVHAFACGGIVVSTNAGKTWTRSSTAFNEPYFLGMVTTRDGEIAASYTTLVRDTTEPVPDFGPLDEALTHRMEDRVVVRSTDNGRTWAEVYRTPINRGFRILGGDGIRLRDGRLLLITVDDILESTDDGLTWDFHVNGIQETVNPVSMFTNDAGSVIYYCTDKGLYSSDVLTSVSDVANTAVKIPREARSWSAFQTQWSRSARECLSLTGLCGDSFGVNATTAPSPGLYLATMRWHNVVSTIPILVLGE